MQSLHPFRGSIQQYAQELSDPDRYRPDHCPLCHAPDPLRALIEENFKKTDHRLRIFCTGIEPAYLVQRRVQRSRDSHGALVRLYLWDSVCVLLVNKSATAVFLHSQRTQFIYEEEKLVWLKISQSAQNQIYLFSILGIRTGKRSTCFFDLVASFLDMESLNSGNYREW